MDRKTNPFGKKNSSYICISSVYFAVCLEFSTKDKGAPLWVLENQSFNRTKECVKLTYNGIKWHLNRCHMFQVEEVCVFPILPFYYNDLYKKDPIFGDFIEKYRISL